MARAQIVSEIVR